MLYYIRSNIIRFHEYLDTLINHKLVIPMFDLFVTLPHGVQGAFCSLTICKHHSMDIHNVHTLALNKWAEVRQQRRNVGATVTQICLQQPEHLPMHNPAR